MGEIIHVDFGKKTSEQQKIDSKLNKKEINNKDVVKEINLAEIKDIGIDPYSKFGQLIILAKTQKIMDLDYSPSTFEDDSLTVEEYTTEELIDLLKDTNEKIWRSKGAFFRAVYLELNKRTDKK